MSAVAQSAPAPAAPAAPESTELVDPNQSPQFANWLAEIARGGQHDNELAGLVDLRAPEQYWLSHCRGATSVPLAEFSKRLLPPRQAALGVVLPSDGEEHVAALVTSGGVKPTRTEAARSVAELVESLQARYRVVFAAPWPRVREAIALHGDARALVVCESAESAPLWRASPCVRDALACHGVCLPAAGDGVAVDIGCGSGRDVVHLALNGWLAVGLDASRQQVALTNEFAALHSVAPRVRALVCDVERTGAFPPAELARPHLVSICRFLHRPLFDAIRAWLLPGGWLLVQSFTEGARAFGHPRHEKHFVRDGELARLFADWMVVVDEVRPIEDGRPVSYFIARKPL